GWQKELWEMNRGKNGRPFRYPHSLVLFLGALRVVFRLPYRQLEGLARGLGKLISIPAPDYSTLSLRLPTLDLPPVHEPKEWEEVMIAGDGTGIKVTNRGEWMRKKRKGYIKIQVGVDIRTKQAVSLEVTDEVTADGEKLKPLVKRAQRRVKVKRALGGGGYDTHDNFKFLAACGIEAALKVREDSNPSCGGQREEVVRAYLKDPPGWKERVSYGQRWMAESAVSAS
ncbi:MAG: IS5 family transposase, partial [Candidatus Bipolaricaulia bacterium]